MKVQVDSCSHSIVAWQHKVEMAVAMPKIPAFTKKLMRTVRIGATYERYNLPTRC